MLKFTTVSCWIIFFIAYVMSLTVPGGPAGLQQFFAVDYERISIYKIMVVAFYSIGKLGFLIPTGYMTASAYAKFPKRLGTGAETLLLVTANVLISVFFLSGLYAIAGALADVFKIKLEQAMAPSYALYLALITQFLTHMDCPNSFMLVYLLCFWLIQVVKVAIVIHLVVLNLYDYLPQLSYFPNYVVMSVVGVCGVMSLIGCLRVFVLVIEIMAVNYIVLCLNVHTFIETNLLKPQFFWGPPRRDIRVSRKSFAPRTSIRSQPPRKKKQRFRVRSIKQMHEKDIAEHVKKGRIFVDTAYFKNVCLTKSQLLTYKK
ncbi:sodium:neurotransmitter symporter superfamily [Holotrichia oblita]|uniref:Sodium:neurotransmitter symporter superfamily n=1 Tax=Holotrichia oblita TaxID=644536 RepID=A0ACB9TDP8_HOLOL|nr:sodium:neurotransmitter symporter superfamily [Holotrichia oblita]